MNLKPELTKRLDEAVVERVREAVADAQDRDRELLSLEDQLEGRTSIVLNQRWPNACRLEDTLTREHHLTLLASMTAAWRRNQFWLCEAIDPTEAETVRRVETYMNVRARQYGMTRAMYDVAYNALASRYAPMYVGWKSFETFVRGIAYRNPETGQPELEQPEGEEWESVPVRRRIPRHNGLVFRAIAPEDFYLYPANQQDATTAPMVMERIRMTPEGVAEEFGLDALKRVRGSYDEERTEAQDARDDDVGTVGRDDDDAEIVLYVVTGRVPILMDGDALDIEEWMLGEDFEWIVHQPSGTVLRFEPLGYPMRPYVVFNGLRLPGRLMGHGIVSLLKGLQDEATANLRFTIDSMNLAAAPAMKVSERYLNKYGKWAMYPGALVPYINNPDEVQAMTWDMRGINAGMALAGHIDNKASKIASAQGLSGMLGGKVRKAAEVEATVGLVEQKSDLFFQCLQEGLEDVGRIVLALYLSHMGEDGDVAVAPGGQSIRVTPDDLERRMRIMAYATSEDASAELRAQKTMAMRKVQSEYIAMVQQSAPYTWRLVYKSAYQSLLDLGARTPIDWLGEEPPQLPPPWMAPQTATQQTAPALAGLGAGPSVYAEESMPV